MYRDLLDEEVGGATQRKHQMRLDRLRAIQALGYVIRVRVDSHMFPYRLYKVHETGRLDFVDSFRGPAWAINRAEREAKKDAEKTGE